MASKLLKPSTLMLAGVLTGSSMLINTPAQAGVTLNLDDERWIKIGAGLRASANLIEDGTPSGEDTETDFSVQNMRFYLTAQAAEGIQFTFNTEKDSSDNIKLLDAAAKFKLDDAFNVWVGRVLIPTDRANLDGPFYQASFDFPSVRKYPAIFAGRDDGVIFWGKVNDNRVKYYFGATQGRTDGPNDTGSLLYSGRLSLNLWDTEDGYYNRSTYHGKKDILAFGLGGAYQADGAGSDVANQGDFTAWNADFLVEKKLSTGGVGTLEAAYYSYDLDGVIDDSGLKAGDSYLALASYLFPQKVGMGQFQPYARIQNFDYDEGGEMDKTELGMNYVISSHNALISAVISKTEETGQETVNTLKIGTQVQF